VREALNIVLVEYVDEVLREALKLENPADFFRPLDASPPPAGTTPQ
jgi:hypothetical protein